MKRQFTELKKNSLLNKRANRLRKTVKALIVIRARCVAKRPVGEPQPTIGDLFYMDAIRKTCIQCAEDPGPFSGKKAG